MTARRPITQPAPAEQPLFWIGAHDALTARLGEEAGFDVVWASSLAITASHCVPDEGILPREEFTERIREIVRAVKIPVIADADAGFGDAFEAGRTAQRFSEVGASGMAIEDKCHPKRNSLSAGPHPLEHVDVFCRKIDCALRSRLSDDFLIIARTEAMVAGESVESAIQRATAYAAAGADSVIFHSNAREDELVLDALKSWNRVVPAGVIPTTYYSTNARRLRTAGASFVIYANQGLRSSIAAMKAVFAEVLSLGSTASIETRLTPIEEVFRLQESREDECVVTDKCSGT